jgi:hypothetical protein
MRQSLRYTFILFTLIVSNKSLAQDIYGTANGIVQITAVVNDTVVLAQGRDLKIVLNYETAEIMLELDKNTLSTGSSYLDSLLYENYTAPIQYIGQLDLDYIRTQKHPPQDFEVDGFLSCDPTNHEFKGQGHLEHIFNGIYSCILTLSFHLSLEEIGIEISFPGVADEIHVEIVQTVLKRSSER